MAMRNDKNDHRPIRRLLLRLIQAPNALALVWPMALLIGSFLAYSRWYKDHFNTIHARLKPDAVTLSEPHQYVRTNIVNDVYDASRLKDLSPVDHNATAKLASAFGNHPWVRHVQSVRKLPDGKFDVQLEYRKPVAVFRVTGDPSWLKEVKDFLESRGYSIHGRVDQLYFPLDGEGVILPTDHLSLEDANQLIHIEVYGLYPQGDQGLVFGDRRVESAAILARLLNAVRDRVSVAKIMISGDPRMNLIPQLELVLGDGTQLHWGSPPGMEQPDERNAKSKLSDLLSGQFVSGGNLRIATRRPIQ